MITRQEAVRRLEKVARDIAELKAALEEGSNEKPSKGPTQGFLKKCKGWKDSRSPEEIIGDIYAERTASSKGASIFNEESA